MIIKWLYGVAFNSEWSNIIQHVYVYMCCTCTLYVYALHLINTISMAMIEEVYTYVMIVCVCDVSRAQQYLLVVSMETEKLSASNIS